MSNQDSVVTSGAEPASRRATGDGAAAGSLLRATLAELAALLKKPAAGTGASADKLGDTDGELRPILYLNWRSATSEEQGQSFLASTGDGSLLICEGTTEQPGAVLWRLPVAAPAARLQPVVTPPAAEPRPQPPAPRVSSRPSAPPSVVSPAGRREPRPLLPPRTQEVYIASPVSGKRLGMDLTRAGHGARLVLQEPNGGEHQRFTLTPQPHHGGFLLSASHGPLIINAALGRRNQGWQLIEMGGQGDRAPVFAVEPTAEGDFRIRAPQSGRWLAAANVTGVEMPVLDASAGEEQASRWQITAAPETPRLALLDLMSGAPRPKVASPLDVLVERGQLPCVDALGSAPFRAFAGDFLKRGRDQLMLVRVDGRFHHIDLLDLATSEVIASTTVEPGGWIDGWLGAHDLQLVGDLAGLGSSQLLLLHRGQRRPGEQAILLGLDGGPAHPDKIYTDSQGERQWLDGWLDPEDAHLVGDFMGLGYDQWMMLNRNPRGGRVRIVDIKSGTPRRCYTEMWGQSPLLDGWMDAGRQMLVGDFLKRGHAQVLFINRNVSVNTGKMIIADFCRAAPPAEIGYRELWGQSELLKEFLADGDSAIAGDFMGRGHAQVLFVSRKGYGDKFLVADFHSGAPPIEVCVREQWGQRGEEARHEARVSLQSTLVAGRFRPVAESGFPPSQIVLI